jgi:hypothetical protein
MPADPLAIRTYYAISCAPFHNKISLLALLQAAYAALSPAQAVANLAGSEINVYSYSSNTVAVLVGDARLTTTNYGFPLTPGSSRRYGPYFRSTVPLDNIYLMSENGETDIRVAIEVLIE